MPTRLVAEHQAACLLQNMHATGASAPPSWITERSAPMYLHAPAPPPHPTPHTKYPAQPSRVHCMSAVAHREERAGRGREQRRKRGVAAPRAPSSCGWRTPSTCAGALPESIKYMEVPSCPEDMMGSPAAKVRCFIRLPHTRSPGEVLHPHATTSSTLVSAV